MATKTTSKKNQKFLWLLVAGGIATVLALIFIKAPNKSSKTTSGGGATTTTGGVLDTIAGFISDINWGGKKEENNNGDLAGEGSTNGELA